MCLDLLPPFVSLSPLSGSCLGKTDVFIFFFLLSFLIFEAKTQQQPVCGSKQKM